jgi:hypothetical protein
VHKAITEYVVLKVQEASLVLRVLQVLRALVVLQAMVPRVQSEYQVARALRV